MKLIRTILESDKEPLFKEVGWLYSINGRLSLDFYKNGKWESVSSFLAVDATAVEFDTYPEAKAYVDEHNLVYEEPKYV